jgi:SAM-dependent methyltransferase
MRDQRALWESIYGNRAARAGERGANELALSAGSLIAPASRLLELGCGAGQDARFFASLGHDVVAVDHSENAIGMAMAGASTRSPQFLLADISAGLGFRAATFDLVYARLSLHYFTNAVTELVFREIRRVLKRGGFIAFMCRSTADGRYGKGVQIEPHMFDEDHARHFFSLEYTAECLNKGFQILSLSEQRGKLYGNESAYVSAIARRRN